MSSANAASSALSSGIINWLCCLPLASAVGNTPDTFLKRPSRASSPIISYWLISFTGTCPDAINMPIAIGRSNRPPVFGISAGAKFTVIRLAGNSNPELIIAPRTLSLLSLTAVSGKPTVEKAGKPFAKWTSTITGNACTPNTVRVRIIAKDFLVDKVLSPTVLLAAKGSLLAKGLVLAKGFLSLFCI